MFSLSRDMLMPTVSPASGLPGMFQLRPWGMSVMLAPKTAESEAPLGCSTGIMDITSKLSFRHFGAWTHRVTTACPQNRMPGLLPNRTVTTNQSGPKLARFKSLGMSGTTLNGL